MKYKSRRCLPFDKHCFGKETVEEKCKEKDCTNEIEWNEWSDWSACSKTCGEGIKYRSRKCNQFGENCFDEETEGDGCKEEDCQKIDELSNFVSIHFEEIRNMIYGEKHLANNVQSEKSL